jgi:hypothetical protein
VNAAEFNARVAKAMREAELSEQVRQMCKTLGLLAYHTHTSKFSAAGWPDWVILGPRRLILRELKRETEDPSPAQTAWLNGLLRAGYDADVWRPSDLLSGRITSELQQLASGSPGGPGGSTPGVARDVQAENHSSTALFDSRAGTDRDASAYGPGAVGGAS